MPIHRTTRAAALLLAATLLLVGCAPQRVQEHGRDIANSTRVQSIVFVESADVDAQPVTRYQRAASLHAHVALTHSPAQTRLLFRWYDKASGELMFEQEHLTGTQNALVQVNVSAPGGAFPTGTFILQVWLADLDTQLDQAAIDVD